MARVRAQADAVRANLAAEAAAKLSISDGAPPAAAARLGGAQWRDARGWSTRT